MAERDGAPSAPVATGPIDLDERKERVLHTRVPDSLDRHIKQRARSLGMSVSTVVRNVLLTTFGLVEDIVNDSTAIALAITGDEAAAARSAVRHRARAASPPAPGGDEIVAWHEAVLNVNAVCDQCNAVLRKGTRAAVGVSDRPGRRAVICRRCLRRVEEAGAIPPGRKRR
jgi:hypothetical protein